MYDKCTVAQFPVEVLSVSFILAVLKETYGIGGIPLAAKPLLQVKVKEEAVSCGQCKLHHLVPVISCEQGGTTLYMSLRNAAQRVHIS